ncbi:hypothetical protein HPB50_017180 [Hyalomma asiaticum]|uniref:Uncharacterized protein n=1 Tax=Hyalomma asiaticum TaxID=266040 RepID=A0ACB7TJ86_HYAAI|nr:hypothetical protein HPB50_017180 [Hyalomma asiaticum]
MTRPRTTAHCRRDAWWMPPDWPVDPAIGARENKVIAPEPGFLLLGVTGAAAGEIALGLARLWNGPRGKGARKKPEWPEPGVDLLGGLRDALPAAVPLPSAPVSRPGDETRTPMPLRCLLYTRVVARGATTTAPTQLARGVGA